MVIIKKCAVCSVEFITVPSKNGKCCSQKCSGLHRSATMLIHKNCLYCNTKFSSRPSKESKYCSRKCKDKTAHTTTNCFNCNKKIKTTLSHTPKFCSPECRSQKTLYNSKRICPVCNVSFNLPRGNLKKKYCCRKCVNVSTTIEHKEKEKIKTNLNSLLDNLEPMELDLSDNQIEDIFNLLTLPDDLDSYSVMALKK